MNQKEVLINKMVNDKTAIDENAEMTKLSLVS